MTLYPVSITEARDPAGHNASDFVASVPPYDQATPGNEVLLLMSQKCMLTLSREFVGSEAYVK